MLELYEAHGLLSILEMLDDGARITDWHIKQRNEIVVEMSIGEIKRTFKFNINA